MAGLGARLKARAGRSDLAARVASGVVMAAAGALAVWAGGWVLAAFVALGCGVMGWEWRGITAQRTRDRRREVALAIATAGLPPLLSLIWGVPLAMLVALVMAALLAWFELKVSGRALWTSGGVLVVALAGCAFVWLRERPELGLETAMWLPLTVAGADMGGYFAGRAIGGPKLAPTISPNKTISGAVGGILLALALGSGFAWAAGLPVLPVAVLSVVIAMVSQAGDLSESAAKRRFAVKDASKLLPGHGGVMDRLDGVIAATLFVAAFTVVRGAEALAW